MPRRNVTIKRKGFNYYEVRVGGKPKIISQGKINAQRQANILRKKLKRKTII